MMSCSSRAFYWGLDSESCWRLRQRSRGGAGAEEEEGEGQGKESKATQSYLLLPLPSLHFPVPSDRRCPGGPPLTGDRKTAALVQRSGLRAPIPNRRKQTSSLPTRRTGSRVPRARARIRCTHRRADRHTRAPPGVHSRSFLGSTLPPPAQTPALPA